MTRDLQQQASRDKIDTLQERLGQDTRDLLLRFAQRKAFSGAKLPGMGSLTQGL